MKKEKSEVVSQVLTKIYEEHEEVTPGLVVLEATPKDSPIHDKFEWDNTAAAHEHRLSQARRLIRYYPIFIEDTGTTEQLYHIVMEEAGESSDKYLPISVVVADDDLFDSAKRELMKQVNAIIRSIQKLDEAAKASGNAERASRTQVLAEKLNKLPSDVAQL
jgi:hypothetical protein